jgi:hypothetical protein
MDAIFAGLITDGGEWPERVVTTHWPSLAVAIGYPATTGHSGS